MGRRPDLSPELKTKILVLRDTNQWPGTWIARELNLSTSAVNKFLASPNRTRARRVNGRRRKVTDWMRRRIIGLARNQRLSASQIQATRGVNCSLRTVQRYLAADPNLRWKKMVRKPPLSQQHKDRRLNFGLEHITWTTEWDQVVFSDEKKFNLDGPDGIRSYWHDLRDEPQVISKRGFGGGSVMVWAAFGRFGKTAIVRLHGRQNALNYQATLQHHLLPAGPLIGGQTWTFQQDNASIHAARSTLEWLEANQVSVLDWPSRSPDLNPIENLWGWLVRIVYRNGRQFQTTESLQRAIEEAWNEVPPPLLGSLIDSMESRMKAQVLERGGSTRY